jgi:hypothetical protein
VPHYGIEIHTSVYFFDFQKGGNRNGGKDVGDGGDVTNVNRPMYVMDVNSFYFPWFMILWIYSYIVSQRSSLYSKKSSPVLSCYNINKLSCTLKTGYQDSKHGVFLFRWQLTH